MKHAQDRQKAVQANIDLLELWLNRRREEAAAANLLKRQEELEAQLLAGDTVKGKKRLCFKDSSVLSSVKNARRCASRSASPFRSGETHGVSQLARMSPPAASSKQGGTRTAEVMGGSPLFQDLFARADSLRSSGMLVDTAGTSRSKHRSKKARRAKKEESSWSDDDDSESESSEEESSPEKKKKGKPKEFLKANKALNEMLQEERVKFSKLSLAQLVAGELEIIFGRSASNQEGIVRVMV